MKQLHISDETEDMLQECPIYLELVGDKLSKRAIAGIVIGILLVISVVVGFIYFRLKKSKQRRQNNIHKNNIYNLTATA